MKYLIAAILLLFSAGCVRQYELFVSPSGDDANPGSSKKPLATIEEAKDRVNQILQENPAKAIIVWLDEGTYSITKPIKFESEDSGPESSFVAFKALPGTNPIISGGKRLLGWEPTGNGVWTVDAPEMALLANDIRELYIDDKRAPRARHPNTGYIRVEEVGKDKRTNFYFNAGDFPIPNNPRGTELVLLHDWSISRIALDSINEQLHWLRAKDTIGARRPSFFTLDNWEPNPRYFLENDQAFMDEDYEWYYDRIDQKIYLRLPDNIHPDSLQVITPVSQGLIEIEGSEARPVSNIRFSGIAFKYSRWSIPEEGYGGIQACHYDPKPMPPGEGWGIVPAAVKGRWIQNIIFDACTFEHLGGSGLWLGPGSKNCTVRDCQFSDISGNGLMIGEGRDRLVDALPWWQVLPEQAADSNTVENCSISTCGQQFYGAVGIWCGLTANTTIIRNEISNLPYTGISIGWMWNPAPTPCKNNRIVDNHIHHIMGELSDGGGIYMLGLQPGSRLEGNHIHDVTINAGRAESNGMFLDEGTTDVVVEGNLIYNIAKSPLRFHRATTNLVKDNILMCGEETPPIRYNRTEEEDIKKEGNKVLSVSDPEDREELKAIISQWK